jgi:hypothetical protein
VLKEIQDHKGHKELKELKGLLEKSGLEDHRVPKAHKVLEEELVMSVL